MPRARRFCWIPLLALFAGCGRGEPVAEGRIVLSAVPRGVGFSHVVSAYGPARELCFEFSSPDDSRRADRIRAVLIAADGRRDSLLVSSVERRGEALVALVDGVTDRVNDTPPMRYRAVVLSSDAPVEIRAIRWNGGERRRR